MNDRARRMFEHDRRMEFKLRLAAKRADEAGPPAGTALVLDGLPDRQILDRLIEKVRRL
jgi:hypothetical protein